MTKIIEVTGEKFQMPKDFEKCDNPYSCLANIIAGYSAIGPCERVAEKYRSGKVMQYWAGKILVQGPGADGGAFGHVASALANELRKPLELRLDKRKPDSMGSLLGGGKIIVRGNVGKNTGHCISEGWLYVDGNADSIVNPGDTLITYVKGDVGSIERLYGTPVVIIAGKVKESSQRGFLNSAGPISPSPFVFTSTPISLYGYCGDHGGEQPVGQSIVVPGLKDWKPEELEERALELCKDVVRRVLDEKRERLNSFERLADISKFYEREIEGYSTGFSRGHHEGVVSALPSDD